jgi:NAD-dependent DNA ligase
MNNLNKEKLEEYTTAQFLRFCNQEKLSKLHNLKLILDDLYYNTDDSILSDQKYDTLKICLNFRDPGYVPPIGAKIRCSDNKKELPFYMGSADKVTPLEKKELNRWIDRNPCDCYIISDKLDGVSCGFVSKNGKIKLYTRGDGKKGSDISYLAQYLDTVPKNINIDICVRGELIIPKKLFDFKYKGKIRPDKKDKVYRNSRSTVAGFVSGKTIRSGIKDVQFIVYEEIGDITMDKPSKQLKKLKDIGFTVVKYEKVGNIDMDLLKQEHDEFKNTSNYEIDGIIIQSDINYDRNIDKNPSYMFAFKMMDNKNVKEAIVRNVEWNISRSGAFKPVVIIDPIDLQDVTISRISGHHAKRIVEQKIGIGAVILVTRSKEVIPFIVDVIKEAKVILMPDIEYKWDDQKVNIFTVNLECDIMVIKNIVSFFEKMKINYINEATVTKIYKNGLTTLLSIISADKKMLMNVEGIQSKSADRILKNIKDGLTDISFGQILGASGIFGIGIGRKRVISLLKDIPDILQIYKNLSKKELLQKISDIDGFSDIMAVKIVQHLEDADNFIVGISKYATFKQVESLSSNIFKGKKIVMTGFRDSKIELFIQQNGGTIANSVSKNTSFLIIADKKGKKTGKLEKAIKLEIQIYERDEFTQKYKIL